MPHLRSFSKTRGVTVIEIVVAVTILTIGFGGVLALASFALVSTKVASQTLEATALAEGAVEAVRNYRDGTEWDDDDTQNEYDGLGVVAVDVPYYPSPSSGTPQRWRMLQGTEAVGIFQRSVTFSNVQRDGADTIVASGGTVDLNTKEVRATVSWQERGRSHTVELVSYFTNWDQ